MQQLNQQASKKNNNSNGNNSKLDRYTKFQLAAKHTAENHPFSCLSPSLPSSLPSFLLIYLRVCLTLSSPNSSLPVLSRSLVFFSPFICNLFITPLEKILRAHSVSPIFPRCHCYPLYLQDYRSLSLCILLLLSSSRVAIHTQ